MRLHELLEKDAGARRYFSSLPVFVQESLAQTSPEFQSFEEMLECVEKLMR